jgi:hypothetical protein
LLRRAALPFAWGILKERHHYANLMIAAPEMFELLYKVRNHIDGTCHECESKAIVPEIDALLEEIERKAP